MSLIFHQLKKDILRTRVVLAIWLLLVVLRFALVGWTANSADTGMQTLYPMFSMILSFLNILLILVLVPLIIHQEPLVGTTAFWFTRPVPRSAVMVSKALYILLLIVVPLIAQSIVFLANGITPHDVAVAVSQLFLQVFFWIVVAAAIAVLTPNFARFAIVCVVVLIAWFLSILAIQYLVMAMSPRGFSASAFSLSATRGLMESLVMILFGCTVVIVQYLSRRRMLAISLAVAGVLLGMLVGYVWPWDLLKPPVQLLQDSTFKPDAISVELNLPIQISDRMSMRGELPSKQIMNGLSFKGCPKGYLIKAGNIYSDLTTVAGQKIPILPTDDNQMNWSGPLNLDAIELALGGVPIVNMNERGGGYPTFNSVLFAFNADNYDRYLATPINYSAKFDCVASKYIPVAELPLARGAQYEHGSDRITVTDILHRPDGVDILLRQRNVQLLFAPRSRDKNPYMEDMDNIVYVLVNKKRHQAMIRKGNTMNSFNFSQGILSNQPVRLSFGPEDNNGSEKNWLLPKLDDDWLAEAVLVRLDLMPVATFPETLALSNVTIAKLREQPRAANTPFQPKVADLETLEKIVLPPNAIRAQVREYITAILTASQQVNTSSPNDPQIEMLERVGPQNVDLLIQMATEHHNFYLNTAIDKLIQPDQKQMLIDALLNNTDLINVVVSHGWQNDAKSELLALFAQPPKNGGIPYFWVLATVSLKDPASYPALRNYYLQHPQNVFDAYKTLPNFDLAGMVDEAWKKSRFGQPWTVAAVLRQAVSYGEPDALETAFKILKAAPASGFGIEYCKQEAHAAIKQCTPAPVGDDAALISWWESNKANLTYDPQAMKYVLGPVPAAASPTPTRTSTPPSS